MRDIFYGSTRGRERGLSASEAILKGLASDGGLFMPDCIPAFDFEPDELLGQSYQEAAYRVLRLFLTDYTEEELRFCIDSAYGEQFDTEEIAPLTEADGAFYLELFHGRTIAFKDMALSLLPYLLTTAAKKNGVTDTIEILTATSGDTGKAAMAGFADVPGTGIIVFYPKDGVSSFQKRQMVTQTGGNVSAVALRGNFDDAQSGVKSMLGDRRLAERLRSGKLQFSSANSINIGRLIPQAAYYVWAYLQLREGGKIARGEEINVCVPTGNFGNILAAYFAKRMGLPIRRLICASNENRVLTDFFETGRYDRNREFILTASPSMDILVSSNLERLIYLSCGEDAAMNRVMMLQLKQNGRYTATREMRKFMGDFLGGSACGGAASARIRALCERTGYVIDPHTAVASAVYEAYREESGDPTKTVIAATASPYKFARTVMEALDGELGEMDDWAAIDLLRERSGVPVPPAAEEIRTAKTLHRRECGVGEMEAEVRAILKL